MTIRVILILFLLMVCVSDTGVSGMSMNQRVFDSSLLLFAQITPDLAPKDELTPVALSILRQMKSTATTGTCIT